MSTEKEVNEILGFGEELEVLVGVDKDTKEKLTKKYHFSPVPLKKIPALMNLLNAFFLASEKNDWNEDIIKKCSKMLKMSLEKMHPDISDEEIENNFSLGALAKGISIVMDINDFLSQMQKMNQKMVVNNPLTSNKA
jgi:hypothetical protein